MKKNYYISFLIILMLLSAGIIYAQKPINKINKTAGEPAYYKLNINNISTYIYENGETDVNRGNAGLEYPKGSWKYAVYQSGFVWGAKVNGQIRVGGTTYNSGLLPGVILPDGTAENPDIPDIKIWRVRPDWRTANMSTEIGDGEGSKFEIQSGYRNDWYNWPVEKGAPYEDIDGDGIYNPDIDIAGYPGAGQTIWFAANDFNPEAAKRLYASPPMGIEIQYTMWAYDLAGPFSNMIFRKYKIINKSSNTFEEMYISQWSDADIGLGSDDFTGVDTLLGLGYAYNSDNDDLFYQDNPPATGFCLLQGPVVPGDLTDTATVSDTKLPGMKNLPVTSFFYHIGGGPLYPDPSLAEYKDGALVIYNYFQGKIGPIDEYYPLPGGGVTWFPLSGDPVNQTGYVDGIIANSSDRRYGISSGPFTMAPDDTQEVVYVQIIAGGTPGIENLEAVALLKQYCRAALYLAGDLQIPSAPPAPQVKVTNLNNEIILSWSNPENILRTESHNEKGYKFQGYNIYQLTSPFEDYYKAERIATYDIEDGVRTIKSSFLDPQTGESLLQIEQYGNDTGVDHFINLKRDYLKNKPLINGTKYYYAVTSYSYNPDSLAMPKTIENKISVVTAVPQETFDEVDVDKIKAFPNPYYGVNANEINHYERFITFSHLPARAVIRIFDLAGQLVRKIDKDDPSQFLRWDLTNDNALAVASGLFIVYIEMPEAGKTKILKVSVIQEQMIPERF